jgi:hypothetical protein
MDKDYGGSRRSWRAGRVATMAAGAVLATVTACSGGASSAASASGGSTGYEQMLAYSECMRAHGVPDFPDPNAAGNIHVAPGSRNDPMNGPQEPKANSTCRHLEPGGGVASTGVDEQLVSQDLKLAQCMRAHGVPNFPDPTVSGGNVTFQGAFDTGSPQFQNAERGCKSLVPAGMFPSSS